MLQREDAAATFKPQEVANMLLAFAKLGTADPYDELEAVAVMLSADLNKLGSSSCGTRMSRCEERHQRGCLLVLQNDSVPLRPPSGARRW